MPRVSVVVPVYKVEKYIGRCIESVQSQTMTDWELVLVDDVGGDGSMQIIKQYATLDSRVKFVESDKNVGPMIAREKGCRIATGDYITFVDGDDALPKDSLEKLLFAAEVNKADIVIGDIKYNISDSSMRFESNLRYGNDKVSVFRSLLRKEVTHNLCGKLYKREIIQNYTYKIYEGCTHSEDMAVFFQMVNNCNMIVAISEYVYYYYQNTESSSHVGFTDSVFHSIFLMRKIALEEMTSYPQLEDDIKRWLITDISYLFPKYNHKGYLKKKVKDYGLFQYLSVSNIVKSFGLIRGLKYIVKIYYPFW